MKYINLSKNKKAIVDEADYDFLNQWKWCINSNGYALRSVKPKQILMHRLLLNFPDKTVDHINGNKLDNRRSNLRVASHSQSGMNQRTQKNKSSKYKGVYKHSNNNSYVSNIRLNGKTIYLGSFDNEKDAAKAYNKAAIKYFKEYAKLNVID